MNTFNAAIMTSRQLEAVLNKSNRLIIPLASFEALGTHGPLGADFLVANHVTPLVAEKAQAVYLPVIPYGDTLELPQIAGNVMIPTDVLSGYYMGVARSFLHQFPSLSIYFLTFHSLNNRAVDDVCRKLAFEGHKPFLIDWWRSVGMGTGDVLDDQEWGTGHGGEMITSVLLHVAPEAVSMEEETNREPKKQFGYYRDHLSWTSSPFAAYTTFADYCEGSSWGVLDNATAEKGEILVKRAVEAISSFIKNSPAQ